ncbi:MAG TPA: GNAT family N-acetyltransferase [Candidatus Binataceae bacterium]|nr:GNAT family N-acetyltransferase [Candidatus Binataceae bacterium]
MQRIKSSAQTAKIKVRAARIADVPALTELYRELHLDDYSYRPPKPAEMLKAYRAIAKNPDHQILVAEAHGKVAGTLHVMIFRHLGHGLKPVAVVENVVVSSAMRSKGVGELMMEAADRIARRNRCYKMSLTTNLKRPRAHQFYERLGWRRTHHGYSMDLKS